jgi:hypothetical protein
VARELGARAAASHRVRNTATEDAFDPHLWAVARDQHRRGETATREQKGPTHREGSAQELRPRALAASSCPDEVRHSLCLQRSSNRTVVVIMGSLAKLPWSIT